MLARSTACRHGLGRTSAKAESMTNSVPSRTIRLAGLMSRWAMPISHIRRTTDSPWSMIASSISASPTSFGAGDELGDQQVLALRGDLDDPERVGHGQPGVGEQPQDVVLVLHQPADAVVRLLVLEPAVEQRPAELVPAVGAHVGGRVELAEDVALLVLGVAVGLDGDLQRRRAARPGQPERLRRRWRARPSWSCSARMMASPAIARHVEVRGPAAAVAHGVDGVGGEQPERGQRRGDAEDDAGQDAGRVVLREVEPGQRGDHEQPADRPLADGPPPARPGRGSTTRADQEGASTVIGSEGIEKPDQRAEDLDLVGPGPLQRVGQ